jgi:N utilization substance protein A
MNGNLFEALHQIAAEKGISREAIESIIEAAIKSAYKKQFGTLEKIRVELDRSDNSIRLISRKMVVRSPQNRGEEIAYVEAVKIKPDVELGDEIEVAENPFQTFGMIATQTAKQVILQKIKEIEKRTIFEEFKEKEGELINGYMQRSMAFRGNERSRRRTIFVDIGHGGTEGILLPEEQSPREHYKPGDRIKALIYEVEEKPKDKARERFKGPNIYLTRARPEFIHKLFEMEIPEIYDEIVTVECIVRDPGMRTKVAVASRDRDIDPVGACVGLKGSRIQSIVRELEGEKVDVVEFSSDRKIMVENALTPARVKEVVEKRDGGFIAVVENDQYDLALGRNNHNVRLAKELCGFEIDILTEEQFREWLSTSDARMMVEQLFSTPDEDETPLSELGLDAKIIKLLENEEYSLLKSWFSTTRICCSRFRESATRRQKKSLRL